MTDRFSRNDPFEIELERVVRRLRTWQPGAMTSDVTAEVHALVQRLADRHAHSVGAPSRLVEPPHSVVSSAQLAEVLRAVAFDAASVADVEDLAPDLAQLRRRL